MDLGRTLFFFSCAVLSSSAEWNYLLMFAPLAATIVTCIAFTIFGMIISMVYLFLMALVQ
jgi:hypothetical protein